MISIYGNKESEKRLQQLCGGTKKNCLSLNAVFKPWEKLIGRTTKETMISQSIINRAAPRVESIEFILSYCYRWINDKCN